MMTNESAFMSIAFLCLMEPPLRVRMMMLLPRRDTIRAAMPRCRWLRCHWRSSSRCLMPMSRLSGSAERPPRRTVGDAVATRRIPVCCRSSTPRKYRPGCLIISRQGAAAPQHHAHDYRRICECYRATIAYVSERYADARRREALC